MIKLKKKKKYKFRNLKNKIKKKKIEKLKIWNQKLIAENWKIIQMYYGTIFI